MPFLLIILIYFIKDPYKVLYHYDSYFISNKTLHVDLDKDFVSTQNFINKYDKYKYDSYIFGGSRSAHYEINEWKKHITGGAAYHFDGNYESLYGIEKKFQFLDRRSVKIKNALLVIDEQLLSSIENSKELISIKHPALSGQSWFSFELYFFKAYIDRSFFIPYLNLIFFNKFEPGVVFLNTKNFYNDTLNEIKWPYTDNAIQSNIDSFYDSKKDLFYQRGPNQQYDSVHLDSVRITMLNNIKNILVKYSTNYKIVINPLYNQLKMNRADLQIINSIFGAKNVYDFSGINDITNDMHNYYEDSHYRPFVANKIMDSVYSKFN